MKKGWPSISIGEVIVENPKSKLKVRDSITGGKFPFFTSGVSVNSFDDFLCDGSNLFIATGGKACFQYYEGKASYSTDCYSVTTRRGFAPKFLFYFLIYAVEDIEANMFEGAALRHLQKTKFKELIVPAPAFAEQKRIIGVLDKAFEDLDITKATSAKNLKNARALFKSHLQGVLSQRGKGWTKKLLGECFRLKSGDGLTSKEMKGGKYPVYGGNGIAGMHDSFNLSGDNVIIGRVGALCGNARHITEEIWLTDNAFKVVDRSFAFDSAFLTYLLNFKDLRSFARQAAQPVISNSSLKDVDLAFPEMREQKRIVAQLDGLSEETQRLAAIYEQKLAALEALKKSLLHQAFAGEL